VPNGDVGTVSENVTPIIRRPRLGARGRSAAIGEYRTPRPNDAVALVRTRTDRIIINGHLDTHWHL
jgi:hypothetical protein